MCISNHLYDSAVSSPLDLGKGYNRPPLSNIPLILLPSHFARECGKIIVKRKLTKSLRSNAPLTPKGEPGDLVQVYINHDNEKQGKWSSPHAVLLGEYMARTVFVTGFGGHQIPVALKDVWAAVVDYKLAVMMTETLHQFENALNKCSNEAPENTAAY